MRPLMKPVGKAFAALTLGLFLAGASCPRDNCCQCRNQCQDVTRSSQCDALCQGGEFLPGTTCNEQTNRCE